MERSLRSSYASSSLCRTGLALLLPSSRAMTLSALTWLSSSPGETVTRTLPCLTCTETQSNCCIPQHFFKLFDSHISPHLSSSCHLTHSHTLLTTLHRPPSTHTASNTCVTCMRKCTSWTSAQPLQPLRMMQLRKQQQWQPASTERP